MRTMHPAFMQTGRLSAALVRPARSAEMTRSAEKAMSTVVGSSSHCTWRPSRDGDDRVGSPFQDPRNRIAVVLGLGCGLRQGEVFGFSSEDIDYLRGVLHVRRQVQAINGKLYFSVPKGKKTRVVDMPPSVAEELKRHVGAYPPVEVELPWGKPEADGQRRKFSLLLTTRFGNAVAVNTWNTYTWKPALAKAGIIPPRAKGAKDWQWEAAPKDPLHVLRHTYASIMLEAGESVVTLVARALLTDGHPRLLCSLHAGGRKQGADGHRWTTGETGTSACQSKLPRFSRGLMMGDSRCCVPPRPSVDLMAEEAGGLGKC